MRCRSRTDKAIVLDMLVFVTCYACDMHALGRWIENVINLIMDSHLLSPGPPTFSGSELGQPNDALLPPAWITKTTTEVKASSSCLRRIMNFMRSEFSSGFEVGFGPQEQIFSPPASDESHTLCRAG